MVNGAQVMIIVGSDSDLPAMQPAFDFLDKMEVAYDLHISSAHRTPQRTADLVVSAEDLGVGVIIAAAGGAAHLPGVIAAQTPLPVIGVPIKTDALAGVDSLYSIVQMPSGVPVATVGINAAKNAAILAVQILSNADFALRDKIRSFKQELEEQVTAKDLHLQEVGLANYKN